MSTDVPPTTHVRRVGFVPRFGAQVLDLVVTWIIVLAIAGLSWAALRATGSPEEIAVAAFPAVALVVIPLYWIVLHAHGRQTVGKRLIGAVVVDLDLRPLRYGRSVGRLLAEFVSSIPFYLGYLWALWDGDRQTFHDKLAGTLVVRKVDLPA